MSPVAPTLSAAKTKMLASPAKLHLASAVLPGRSSWAAIRRLSSLLPLALVSAEMSRWVQAGGRRAARARRAIRADQKSTTSAVGIRRTSSDTMELSSHCAALTYQVSALAQGPRDVRDRAANCCPGYRRRQCHRKRHRPSMFGSSSCLQDATRDPYGILRLCQLPTSATVWRSAQNDVTSVTRAPTALPRSGPR